MEKSRIDSATLAVASAGAVLGLLVLPGPLAWMASIGGLVLLIMLLSYDEEGYRSVTQSLAFSAACGLCLAVACGVLLQVLASRGEVHLQNGQWSSVWMPLICAFGTAIFLAIDRVRMSAREPVEMRQARARAAVPQGFIPRATVVAEPISHAAPVYSAPVYTAPPVQPVPQRVEPIPEPVSIPTVVRETVAPPPPAEPVSTQPLQIQSMFEAATAPRLSPEPIIPRSAVPAGKPATIYVTLLGEGMNMLRSVEAEHLGRDYYRIVESMPEGESWEFGPGQVVRCKKRNLSSGKALVAVEEAPRAQ